MTVITNYLKGYVTATSIFSCLAAAGTIHVIASPSRSKVEKVAAGIILGGVSLFSYLNWKRPIRVDDRNRAAPPRKNPESLRKESTPEEIADKNLIELWDQISLHSKPVFQGTLNEQAREIRTWMSGHIQKLKGIRILTLRGRLSRLPPEIGYLRALTGLDLGGNHLESLPREIGNLQDLTELYLNGNQLESLPNEIGNLTALTRLDLGGNQLRSLPREIGNLQALTELYLSANQLRSLPREIGNLQALTGLVLSANQLESLPSEVGNLQALTGLYLHANQLQTLSSEIGNLQALTELYLTSNQLRSLPSEIGNLRALTGLYLGDNQLQSLPDFIFTLPQNHHILVEGNLFSAQYAQNFLQRLAQHRTTYPGQGPQIHLSIHDDITQTQKEQTLSQRLQDWSVEFAQHFPQVSHPELWKSRQMDFQSLLSLEDEQATRLNTYLRRLRETNDYTRGGPEAKKNIVLRTERMVQLACSHPEFREEMLKIIKDGLGKCGDRVQLSFNEIEIEWQLQHRELSSEEIRSLAIRASRYDRLTNHAYDVINIQGLGDGVETALYYHTQLQDVLNLPITTQGMLYPGVSGVNQEMLEEAAAKILQLSEKELLATSRHWHKYMSRQNPERTAEIEQYYQTLHDAADEYYNNIDDKGRPAYLEKHPNLKKFLDENTKIQSYDEASDRIVQIRGSSLANPSTSLSD